MTSRLVPYLVMNGNTREAIEFYQKALGASVVGVVSFGDMPGELPAEMPQSTKDLVAHALLKVGDSDLMLSDTFPGQPYQIGDQVTVCVLSDDASRTKEIYEALLEGGQAEMPLQETSWSPAYAIVKDKFGVTFQLSTEGAK